MEVAEVSQSNATVAAAEAEAGRYSSGVLLAQNYVNVGQVTSARRMLDELTNSSFIAERSGAPADLPWELVHLNQQLDSSIMTLRGERDHGLPPQSSDSECEVILWNFQTGEKERTLTDDGSKVYGCAYSNDGKQLATIGLKLDDPDCRGTLTLWDVETGKQNKVAQLPGGFPRAALHLYGSPLFPEAMFAEDDRYIVTWPLPVEVRDAKTLEVLWSSNDRSATVLPDGQLLTYSGAKLKICDAETGAVKIQSRQNMVLHKNFAFDSGQQQLSCICADQLKIWSSITDLDDFESIRVPGISWGRTSPDGLQLAYGTRKGVVTVTSRNPLNSDSYSLLGHEVKVTSGEFNRDGSRLVTASQDGSAKIWRVERSAEFVDTFKTHDQIATIAFSHNGDRIHFAGRPYTSKSHPYCAGSIGWAEKKIVRTSEIETTQFASWPRGDFEFSHDGKILAAPMSVDSENAQPADRYLGAARGGKLGIWQCDNWQLKRVIDTGFSELNVTSWDPASQTLAAAGLSNGKAIINVYSLNESSAELIKEIEVESTVLAMRLHDSHFAVATADHVSIWRRRAGQFEREHWLEVGGKIHCLDFSPDGSKLASADHASDEFTVYDVATGKRLLAQIGPKRLCCVRFSPCGERLALSGFDGTVHLCDSNYGNTLLTLTSRSPSPGTIAFNSRVIFSPDGKKIATNNWKGRIDLWSIEGEP